MIKRDAHLVGDRPRQTYGVGWIQYITLVLAFIGLWQLLSGGLAFLHRGF
jgi:hypothetical protein